jgi:hypothetical protein
MASYQVKVDLIFGEKGIVRGALYNINTHIGGNTLILLLWQLEIIYPARCPQLAKRKQIFPEFGFKSCKLGTPYGKTGGEIRQKTSADRLTNYLFGPQNRPP